MAQEIGGFQEGRSVFFEPFLDEVRPVQESKGKIGQEINEPNTNIQESSPLFLLTEVFRVQEPQREVGQQPEEDQDEEENPNVEAVRSIYPLNVDEVQDLRASDLGLRGAQRHLGIRAALKNSRIAELHDEASIESVRENGEVAGPVHKVREIAHEEASNEHEGEHSDRRRHQRFLNVKERGPNKQPNRLGGPHTNQLRKHEAKEVCE